jgi:hypothetical protein
MVYKLGKQKNLTTMSFLFKATVLTSELLINNSIYFFLSGLHIRWSVHHDGIHHWWVPEYRYRCLLV